MKEGENGKSLLTGKKRCFSSSLPLSWLSWQMMTRHTCAIFPFPLFSRDHHHHHAPPPPPLSLYIRSAPPSFPSSFHPFPRHNDRSRRRRRRRTTQKPRPTPTPFAAPRLRAKKESLGRERGREEEASACKHVPLLGQAVGKDGKRKLFLFRRRRLNA